jgi:DNA-binding transcriptional ArsR family regulator
MASTGRPPLRGLAALVGSEGKRQVLTELSRSGEALTMSELVQRTGLQRTTVRHSLQQLVEAQLVTSREERGRLVIAPVAERAGLLADLVQLDETASDVHPVPGRSLTAEELSHYERHFATLPSVHVAGEYAEEELSTPLSAIAIGDAVD